MMIVTIYIVHSVLKISLKSAVRQFARIGRVPAVANDDHNEPSKIILCQSNVSVLSIIGRKSKYLIELLGRFKYESPPNERVRFD